jgi:multidrug transporter EmrE-like cation transporter
MPIGVLLGFIAYGSFAFGDALIKSFGDSLSIFEIAFFVTMFSFVPALIVKPRGERWRESWRLRHPILTQIRGLLGICSMVLVTLAFTTIPLAETYALVFLTPILVTILSVAILRESMTPLRWFLLAVGFAGVLDGELLVKRGSAVAAFNDLQQRLNRKAVTPKLLLDYPAHLRAYDLLVDGHEDLRELPFEERRKRLQAFIVRHAHPRLDLSPLVSFKTWPELAAARAALSARSAVSAEVCRPTTISHSRMARTGLKKCMPIPRDGSSSTAMISVIDSPWPPATPPWWD